MQLSWEKQESKESTRARNARRVLEDAASPQQHLLTILETVVAEDAWAKGNKPVRAEDATLGHLESAMAAYAGTTDSTLLFV